MEAGVYRLSYFNVILPSVFALLRVGIPTTLRPHVTQMTILGILIVI